MKRNITEEVRMALLKLGMPPEVLYDENGDLKSEYNLTDLELQAILYFIGTGAYKRKNKILVDEELGKIITEEDSKTL